MAQEQSCQAGPRSETGSVVGIGSRVLVGLSGVRISAWPRDFSLVSNVQTGSGIHPTSYSMDAGFFTPRVKRPGRDVDHASACSAEVRMNGAMPLPLPHPCVFM